MDVRVVDHPLAAARLNLAAYGNILQFATIDQETGEITSIDWRKVADAMLGEIIARRDDPKDDLISLLWATQIDGKPMTLDIMEDYAVLLFVAGLDTVINGKQVSDTIWYKLANASFTNQLGQQVEAPTFPASE